MTVNRKTAYATAISLPLTAVLVWLVVRLGWIGVILSATIAIVALIAYRKAAEGPAVGEAVEPALSLLSTSGLPTADETVFLELSATVHWQAVRPQSYHADVARAFVLEQAREVTARWRPAQYSLAQHELAARVGRPLKEDSGEVEIWATDVQLELPEAVQQHLAKMDEVQRDGLLWEVGALNETRVRTYLREDALRTPASAIVWWLARNQGSVEQAVGLADVLTKLSNLATGQDEADGAAEVQLLIAAIQKLDYEARRPAAHDLADALDQADLHTLAKALRDKYNLPTLRPIVDLTAAPDPGSSPYGVAGEA